jgi:hypothetical protein
MRHFPLMRYASEENRDWVVRSSSSSSNSFRVIFFPIFSTASTESAASQLIKNAGSGGDTALVLGLGENFSGLPFHGSSPLPRRAPANLP